MFSGRVCFFNLAIFFILCFNILYYLFQFIHSTPFLTLYQILPIIMLSGRLSVTIPTASTNALGYGAFLGLYANLRYQLLCGVDRAMVNYFDVIGVTLFFSTALRSVLFSIISSNYFKFILITVMNSDMHVP